MKRALVLIGLSCSFQDENCILMLADLVQNGLVSSYLAACIVGISSRDWHVSLAQWGQTWARIYQLEFAYNIVVEQMSTKGPR